MSESNMDQAADFVPEQPLPDNEETQALKKLFLAKFSEAPDFFVSVPGRVNLIGEHIDYCGFSVCPMAIEQHILLATRVSTDGKFTITNHDAYADYSCDIADLKVEVTGSPEWYQYVLCGLKGVIDKVGNPPTGLQMAVLGTIPPSSGLSSSSALVCASLLATARVCGMPLRKDKLAELAAASERFIGTQGGGMDQAIAFLATEGCAKLISFDPLTTENIQLPSGAVFVVANSLAEMNKAATADFNRRVVECRLCCQVLAKRMRLDWRRYRNLMHLQKSIGVGPRHFRALATETLKQEPYSKKELCYELYLSIEDLEKECLIRNTRDCNEFKLKQRLLHVAQEVERVQEFIRLCKSCANGGETPEAALWKLGNLMKKSHESLRDLYECSHDELEKIISLSERRTLGARLTGAGWGGCTIALTTAEKVEDYIKALKDQFYENNPGAEDKDLDKLVFQTKPGGGAVVYV